MLQADRCVDDSPLREVHGFIVTDGRPGGPCFCGKWASHEEYVRAHSLGLPPASKSSWLRGVWK